MAFLGFFGSGSQVYSEAIFFEPLVTALFFLVVFFLFGLVLKYVKSSTEEEVFSKEKAFILSSVFGVIAAFVASLNAEAGTLVIAIVLGAILSRKMNNAALIAGFASFAMTLIVMNNLALLLLPTLVIAIAFAVDEIAKDYFDGMRREEARFGFLHFFFSNRMTRIIAVLYFAFAAAFSWIYFIPLLAFNVGFTAMELHASGLKRKWKPEKIR